MATPTKKVWEKHGLPIRRYWSQPSRENREAERRALSPEGLRWQYVVGVPDSDAIARPGNMDIQLNLFLDYQSNLKTLSRLPGVPSELSKHN